MSKKLLTAAQVASRLDVSAASVRAWCKRGLFPNAELTETLIGPAWAIPESDLDNFSQPPMGRPPKPKASGPDDKEKVKQSKKGSK
jgi:Helix-turn-helix domain